MILIYTHTSTKRLQYICRFIFKEQLGIAYSLTVDAESFKEHTGDKINYSDKNFDSAFTIRNYSLLFENDIKEQQINCFKLNKDNKAFFKTSGGDYPFDIFAASFYLLSRYEEYLPHQKDMYNRYAHENSLAFKEGFLNIPLINIWLHDFLQKLKAVFPTMHYQLPAFKFLPTYDIDIAWSYKHKGFFRNIGGFIKKPTVERLSVLAGIKKDPFNCYDYLNELHKQYNLEPIYFFLVATSKSAYDKNISPFANAMWSLIRQHGKKYDIGLHPSWKSNDNAALLKKERTIIEDAGHARVVKSRQHYIKFTLPDTMNKLVEAGIEHDYSMGYGSINGFRASVASSFHWYDLKKDMISKLIMHPFCFMDANSYYEEKKNADEAYNEMIHYYQQCQKANGSLITIFHNNFLGTDKQFTKWKEMYTQFISQIRR
ncbi:MAG: polysaccharide deacetylase family protein [Ferruginibacter sp.]